MKKATASLVVLEDEHGHKFGAMVHERWNVSQSFYGTCETFVFTFGKSNAIRVWEAKGSTDMYQFSDAKCIGVGGGIDDGRFSLYLGGDMYRGQSSKTECFNNDVLSGTPEFLCMELEVWGFV